MHHWYRLTARQQKWTSWSACALIVLAIGTLDRDIWGLGAFGLMIWAFGDT